MLETPGRRSVLLQYGKPRRSPPCPSFGPKNWPSGQRSNRLALWRWSDPLPC
jgi:hypothetical protein